MADRYFICSDSIFQRLKKETQALFERYLEDDGVMVFAPDERIKRQAERIKELEDEIRHLAEAKAPRPGDVEEILRELCSSAYWYGEDTGDHDMDNVLRQDFFRKATDRINALIAQGD